MRRRHRGKQRRNQSQERVPQAPVSIEVPAEQIMRTGTKFKIAYAKTRTGKLLAKKWLESLVGNAKTMSDKSNLFEHAQILADTGQIRNPQQFMHEQDEFYTFKAAKLRLVCFQIRDVWFVTHGFDKDEKPWNREHFVRAKRIKSEQLQILGIAQ